MRLNRNLDVQTYSANVTTSIDLPKEFVLTGLHLELVISLAITGALTLVDEGPARFIRRAEIVGDGEVLQVWTGEQLCAYNYFQNGRYLNRDVNGTAINDPDPARQHFFLPFKVENTLTPGVAYLDPTRFRSLQLRIVWGNTTDLFSAGTATVNSATLSTTTDELMATVNDLSPKGKFQDFVTSQIVETISAANSQYKIQLPRDHDIWGVLIRVSDSATGKALSDTLLNNIKVVERGSLVKLDLTYNMAQNIQQMDFRLAENYETPTVTGSRVEGYVFLDFLQRGLVDRVHPQAFNQFDLVVDVDASTRLDILPLQLRA